MIAQAINSQEDAGNDSARHHNAKLTSIELENIRDFYNSDVKNKPA